MDISINESQIIDRGLYFLKNSSSGIVNKISELMSGNISNANMSKLILLFVCLAVIYFGSKITNKLAKFGMIVVGVLIISGIVVSYL